MRRILLCVMAISVLLSACETKRVEVLVNEIVERDYLVNLQGPFELNEVFSYQQILDELGLDSLQNTDITNLVVSAEPQPSVKIIPMDELGNQANNITLSAHIINSGNEQQTLFSQQNFPVTLDPAKPTEVPINTLIPNGVQTFQDKLLGFILGTDTSDFSVGLSGDSAPKSGEVIRARVVVSFGVTLVTEQCILVPEGMGDKECTPEDI